MVPVSGTLRLWCPPRSLPWPLHGPQSLRNLRLQASKLNVMAVQLWQGETLLSKRARKWGVGGEGAFFFVLFCFLFLTSCGKRPLYVLQELFHDGRIAGAAGPVIPDSDSPWRYLQEWSRYGGWQQKLIRWEADVWSRWDRYAALSNKILPVTLLCVHLELPCWFQHTHSIHMQTACFITWQLYDAFASTTKQSCRGQPNHTKLSVKKLKRKQHPPKNPTYFYFLKPPFLLLLFMWQKRLVRPSLPGYRSLI